MSRKERTALGIVTLVVGVTQVALGIVRIVQGVSHKYYKRYY